MSSSRARAASLILLIAMATLLAACGDRVGSKPQDKGPTRAAYIVQVNALCKSVIAQSRPTNRRLQALVDSGGTYTGRLRKSPPLLRATYAIQSRKLARFKAIEPPAADRAQIKELVIAAEGALKQLHDAIAIAERGDLKSFIDIAFDADGSRARAELLGTTYGIRADCFTLPIKLQ